MLKTFEHLPYIILNLVKKYIYSMCIIISIGASSLENLILSHVNNKVSDQPVHPLSLISIFVIHSLESKISKLATLKISTF